MDYTDVVLFLSLVDHSSHFHNTVHIYPRAAAPETRITGFIDASINDNAENITGKLRFKKWRTLSNHERLNISKTKYNSKKDIKKNVEITGLNVV